MSKQTGQGASPPGVTGREETREKDMGLSEEKVLPKK